MIAPALLSLCLAAEQWADEPVPPPEPAKVVSPRFGPVAGVHLGVSVSSIGPDVGARGGVRIRLGEHAALSLFADLELVWLDIPSPGPTPILPGSYRPPAPIVGQRLGGFARLELISSSATSVMLVPKLTAGLYFGAVVGLFPGEVSSGLSGGLHLAITRLDPSGWWFPVFFDLGLQGALLGGGLGWRFAFGVGI